MFVLWLHEPQHATGMFFLHGRPLFAINLRESAVMWMTNLQGVIRTKAHMCRDGVIQMGHRSVQIREGVNGFHD